MGTTNARLYPLPVGPSKMLTVTKSWTQFYVVRSWTLARHHPSWPVKSPNLHVHFFTKCTYNEYIGPYFLSHVVLRFLPVNSPNHTHTHTHRKRIAVTYLKGRGCKWWRGTKTHFGVIEMSREIFGHKWSRFECFQKPTNYLLTSYLNWRILCKFL
jgi:hypothetical protein